MVLFVRGELHQPLVLEQRGGLAQPKNLMYNSLLRGLNLVLTHLATRRSTIAADAYRQLRVHGNPLALVRVLVLMGVTTGAVVIVVIVQ